MTLQELREQYGSLSHQMTAILDAADKDNDGKLNSEQKAEYEKLQAAWEQCGDDIKERQENLDRRSKIESAVKANDGARRTQAENFVGNDGASANKNPLASKEYDQAFRKYLRFGFTGMSQAEQLALQVDVPSAGGYMVLPMQLHSDFVVALKNQVAFKRSRAEGGLGATIIPVTNADSLGVPTLANDPADGDWTAEILSGSEDSTMSFGRRELKPHPVAKLLKVSKTLLRKSPTADSFVMDRLAYKLGVTLDTGYTTGTGAGQPLGVFTASANGISTSRDVTTTAAAIEADKLIEAVGTLRAGYLEKAVWLLHRLQLRRIRQLKDGEGNYLWRAGLADGRPDTILGLPYVQSEYATSTATSGDYVAVVGDFSHYWIADALDYQIQRAQELYAATNQDGFFIRAESDGMPVLEEAFARVKLA